MRHDSSATPTIRVRRRARRLAVWNGAVWAIGNGLAGTTLLVYLARELHAEGFGLTVGLIVAAPHVAGLLRLGAPGLIKRLGGRKRFCLASFLLSALTLSALPWVCAPARLPTSGWSISALILLWCLYHLLQYLGTVALWSWLADAAAARVRGRFLGLRERWMVAGTAAAAVVVGLFVWGVSRCFPRLPSWMPYGVAAGLGAAFMFAALLPLILMPPLESRREQRPAKPSRRSLRSSLAAVFEPFRDLRFLPLLLFGCWFSLFNGITQSAQRVLPVEVLGLPLLTMLLLETGARLGQWTVSPGAGALADRLGNRRVMIVCQLAAGAGLLFYAAAALSQWYWLAGAWTLWIAYAGLNVCLPNLMLKLSPRESNAAYIAAFQAMGGLCYAASSILGGGLADRCRAGSFPFVGDMASGLAGLFVFGWIARSAGAAILLLVKEPAARRVGKQ